MVLVLAKECSLKQLYGLALLMTDPPFLPNSVRVSDLLVYAWRRFKDLLGCPSLGYLPYQNAVRTKALARPFKRRSPSKFQ